MAQLLLQLQYRNSAVAAQRQLQQTCNVVAAQFQCICSYKAVSIAIVLGFHANRDSKRSFEPISDFQGNFLCMNSVMNETSELKISLKLTNFK